MLTFPSKATTNNTDSTNSDEDDGVGGTEETGIVEHEVSNKQENVGNSEGTDGNGCDDSHCNCSSEGGR